MRVLLRMSQAIALLAVVAATPLHAETPGEILRREIEAGHAAAAVDILRAQGGAEARMAQGFAQFASSVEKLAQGFYRYGLRAPSNPFVPVARMMLPENPRPAPLDYQTLRSLYQTFLDDLAEARKALTAFTADPASADTKIVLDLNAVRFSLAAPGTMPMPTISLGDIAGAGRQFQPRRPGQSAPPPFDPLPAWDVAFDRADAFWLIGYTHILSATHEFIMAHDWHETFEATGYLFFAGARPPANIVQPDQRDPLAVMRSMASSVADQIALLHLVHWPAGDKVRMSAARRHLKSAIAASRETWKAILAETDDDREWLPSPRQQSRANPGMPITDEMVAGWLKVLDDFDDLLDGRKLLAHWRTAKGIDLKMFFEEPQPFDLVLWATGHASMPFLKDGPTIDSNQWQLWQNLFRNNFLGYAIYIN